LLAFGGGLILNVMPCVLPVVSIKILEFVKRAEESKSPPWRHGLIFALGVMVSFWFLGGLLVVLRLGGEQVGWGFQLQNMGFVVFLTFLMFVLGLSLFGVFEIGMGLTSVGSNLTSR